MGVTLAAFGKVNLFLDVLKKRDDGFHAVNMIMQGVRLADMVTIEHYSENRIRANSPYVPNNENNLAMRAAILMQKTYGLSPVAIDIAKHIPVSAGMAGGSSDAAAVILGMDRLFGLQRPLPELMAVASKIGSDVPFCLYGGTAYAVGRGEVVAPLPTLPKFHIILFKANFGVSTAAVYKAYQQPKVPRLHEQMSADRIEAILKGDVEQVLSQLFNALEPTTFSMYPKVKYLKNQLESMGAEHVLMSGSGPTVFAAFREQTDAWSFYKRAKSYHRFMHLTSTVDEALLANRFCLGELN